MAFFSPQFGDLTGDGILDLVTGSNCCDAADIYLFPGNSSGGFDDPWHIKLVLGEFLEDQYPGKLEGRPHLIDWNGDGHVDLVFLTSIRKAQQDANSDGGPNYQYQSILFVGLGPLEKANAVDFHQELRRRRASVGLELDSIQLDSVRSAYVDPLGELLDAQIASESHLSDGSSSAAETWHIRHDWSASRRSLEKGLKSLLWKVEPALELSALPAMPVPQRNIGDNSRPTGSSHLAFGDFDGDGKFDMIISTAYGSRTLEDSQWRHRTDYSAISACRNIGTATQPQFAAPEVVFEPGPGTYISTFNFINSPTGQPELIAVLGLDDDQRQYEIHLLKVRQK